MRWLLVLAMACACDPTPPIGEPDTGADDASRPPRDSAMPSDTNPDAPAPMASALWPITASEDPGCVQDAFGHRLLSGRDDFHPGWDTCDDDPDDIAGTSTGSIVGSDVHVIAAGVVTRVRRWDPGWSTDPSACPGFCRQGNFIQIRHPDLESLFGGQTVQSVYMHLAQDTIPSAIDVGATVAQGTTLGRVGNTGNNINTVHLHFGLLVGSDEGRIDSDDYVNPLRVLPYPRVELPRIELAREAGADVFDSGECAAAEGSSDTYRTLAVMVEETTPAFDTVRIEVQAEGGGAVHRLDIDARDGVGIDGDADDFEQGCVAVTVEDYREGSPVRRWAVRFGGSFDDHERYEIVRVDARASRDERVLDAPGD